MCSKVGAHGELCGYKVQHTGECSWGPRPDEARNDPSDIDWAREFIARIEQTYEEWAADNCEGPAPSLSVVYESLTARLRRARQRPETAGLLGELYAMQRHHALVAEEETVKAGPPGDGRLRPGRKLHLARAARDALFASRLGELLTKHAPPPTGGTAR
jgi:hypothetical protein